MSDCLYNSVDQAIYRAFKVPSGIYTQGLYDGGGSRAHDAMSRQEWIAQDAMVMAALSDKDTGLENDDLIMLRFKYSDHIAFRGQAADARYLVSKRLEENVTSMPLVFAFKHVTLRWAGRPKDVTKSLKYWSLEMGVEYVTLAKIRQRGFAALNRWDETAFRAAASIIESNGWVAQDQPVAAAGG